MAHTHKTSRVVGYARESVVQHQREALARPWRRPNGSSMHRETQALVERDAWIAGRGTTGEVLEVQALCNTGRLLLRRRFSGLGVWLERCSRFGWHFPRGSI